MDLFNIFGWLVGGSTLAIIAAMVFAPSLLGVAAEYLKALSPIVKGAAEGAVALFKLLWEGVKDMTDNIGSVLLILAVAIGTFTYATVSANNKCTMTCDTCVDKLRQDYKFVPRTKQEKKAYRTSKGLPAGDSFWTRWGF